MPRHLVEGLTQLEAGRFPRTINDDNMGLPFSFEPVAAITTMPSLISVPA